MRQVAYYQTAAKEPAGRTEGAAARPAAPGQPAGQPLAPRIPDGHLLEVVTPVEGWIEAFGSTISEIDDEKQVVRGLKPGDHVAKGHVLATVSSADVGQRKHDFLTAASRLLFDEAALERLTAAGASKHELAEATRHRNASRARRAGRGRAAQPDAR